MRTKEREEKQRANEKEKEEKVGVPVFRTLLANCSRMRTKETEEMQRANEKKEEEEEKVAVRVFRTLVGKFLWKIEEIEEI